MALEKLNPEKRTERRKSKSTPAPAVKKQIKTRHIPQAIRDKVWMRDHGRCQYRDLATGKICNSQYTIQIDHIKPYALGGDHSLDNLQLLCGAHNRHRSKELFG